MKLFKQILVLATLALLTSCGAAKKVAYFQDLKDGDSQVVLNDLEMRVRPGDEISIVVNSKDPALSNLFNLPYTPRRFGEVIQNLGPSSTYSYNQGIMGYTVDPEGKIDFPVLGKIPVEKMTRAEIAEHIKTELITENLVKDPVVTVDFMNLTISVLGEVMRPGRFAIDKDRLSLMDALGMAGDLTIQGDREKVMVIREEKVDGEDGAYTERKVYEVNLNSGYELYASPVYYLQQNDIVYVEPNKFRSRQTTVNGNTVQSASFWVSIATALVSIASTVVVLVTSLK